MRKKLIIFTMLALIVGLLGFAVPAIAKTLDNPPVGADLRVYRIIDAISGELYKFNYSTGTYETDTGSGGSEVDPIFTTSVAYGISSGDITNWNGKLSSFTELDPVFGGSVAYSISSGDVANWNSKLSSFTELDPLWVASASHGISPEDITNWNNKLSSYTETDPVVKGLTGIIVSNGTTISSITNNSSNWNTAYSNTHTQNTDTGTSSTNFAINGSNAIKEGDSRLIDARTPTAHNQSATTITTDTLDGDRLPAISQTKKGAVPLTGTPSGKYLKDDGTWATVSATETDPIVKALTGIIVSNGSTISAITDSHTSWDAGYTYRLTSASGTAPLTLTLNANGLTGSVDLSSKQNNSSNLTSLSGLSYSLPSFVKMTGANTFTLDTATYLTGNQSVSLSGDASGSGATSIAVTNTGLRGVTLPALSSGYLYYNGSSFTFQTPAGGGESEIVVAMSGDVANTTTSLASATGLTFAADANSTYIVEGFIVWDSSALTVGIKIGATATGSPTIQAGNFIADNQIGTPDSSSWNTNDSATATSYSPFTTGCVGRVTAVLKTGDSPSTWQLRFAAETTGQITLKQGSTLRYRKVN